jgi:hypothetical protein
LKRIHLVLVLAVLLCAAYAGGAYAADEVSAGERKKILELMGVMGVKNITRQVSMSVAKQLAYGLKQAQPDIDRKAFEIVLSVSDEVLAARSDELMEKMVPSTPAISRSRTSTSCLRSIGARSGARRARRCPG